MELTRRWAESLVARTPDRIRVPVSATGTCKKHTGGLSLYVSVSIRLEPAESLELRDELASDQRGQLCAEGWLDEILYGVLDILMTRPMTPIRVFRLVVVQVEFKEMEARPVAFRLAARYAASECLKKLEFVVV